MCVCASVCASLSLCVCLKSNCEQAKQPVEFGVQVMQCNRVQNCCTSRQLTDITDICAYIQLMSSYVQTVMLVDCLACHSNSCCQKISYTLCECTRNKNLKSHIKNARRRRERKEEKQASSSPASLRCTQCCHISRPTLTAAPSPAPTPPLPSPWGWLCCFKWFRFHVHADFMPL